MLPKISAKNKVQRTKESGQTLLVILLLLAVVLTITLSVVSRSVTDINISMKEEEAARAFSAAEAGVEQALIGGVDSGTLLNSASFRVIQRTTGGATFYNYPGELGSGETAAIWFLAHDADGSLDSDCSSGNCFNGASIKLCWGTYPRPSGAIDPAIEFNVLYDPTSNGDYSDVGIGRLALDGGSATRRGQNGFEQATGGTCSIDGQNYAFSHSLNFSDIGISCAATAKCLLGARLRFFYNSSPEPFGADSLASGVSLPLQGKVIESTGSSGDANRKIQVVRQFPDLPPIFDFALFSGSGGLTK